MSTLFIDCDHALLLARGGFGRSREDSWTPNWEVVAAIERWQRKDAGKVVVWSVRGEEDATLWRWRILPHLTGIECLAKDARLPRVGDVLVDAAALNAAGTRYPPEQSFLIAPAV